jgi:hypothetical protein
VFGKQSMHTLLRVALLILNDSIAFFLMPGHYVGMIHA